MLNLYFGRENVDKDRFLFETIGAQLGQLSEQGCRKIFLVVPDQFTLQAERNAFEYLKTDGFMDLEILSLTRLASRVLEERGGGNQVHIGKYGRHMLLTRILEESKDELEVFRGMETVPSFIEMVNNFIAQMKQFDIAPEALPNMMEELPEKGILRRKLRDIYQIYSRYSESLEDKYTDSEDYLDLCISKIQESELIKNSAFWITGFHSFMPKNLRILEEILCRGQGLSLVLTGSEAEDTVREGDLFKLPGQVMNIFRDMAKRNGIPWNQSPIGPEYTIEDRDSALIHLEKEIYAWPYHQFENGTQSPAITFCQAANFYAEAESAAAAITELVRDKGCRYRDIGIICNDMEERGMILKRFLDSWEIPAFLDQKRTLLHHPAVVYILSLFDTLSSGWTYDNLFGMVKSGFAPISPKEGDRLGNYALQYRIRGNGWKKDFRYGIGEFGEDGLAELNELRRRLTEPLEEFEREFKRTVTVRGKTETLYTYLRDQVKLQEALKALMTEMESRGSLEQAEETAQVWSTLIQILDQLVELLGPHRMGTEAYCNLLRTGLEAAEVGILPPTADQVTVGTMQRTRTGRLKALFVLGANDGLLPSGGSQEELLNEDEKRSLQEMGIHICKSDDLRLMEEKLAIYKTLSSPMEYLWVSCSAADLAGKESRPSMIFDKLRKIFSGNPVEKDILNRKEPLARIGNPRGSLLHLSEALRQSLAEGRELPEEWQSVWNWYVENQPESLEALTEGLQFRGREENLPPDVAEALYKGDRTALSMSPSRLERYSRCPFAYLVQHGLKPTELRIFETASREVGDLYHECLMRLSQELTLPGLEITAPESPWMQLEQDACDRRVKEILRELAGEYREGMFLSGKEEEYRLSRMEEVCTKVAWSLVSQIRAGEIKQILMEQPFGLGPEGFPAVRIGAGEETVSLRGRIDRIDVLPGNHVKIIDYKSGTEKFDLNEVKGGWRLQLMLYLKAAIQGLQRQERAGEEPVGPGGVFYFSVKEPVTDRTLKPGEPKEEDLNEEIRKEFKLDGILLDDPQVIEAIAGDFSGYSSVAHLRKNADGEIKGTSADVLLTGEEFQALQEQVDLIAEDLIRKLTGGTIRPVPKKTESSSACQYCQYKSICLFDPAFEGCRYEKV